MKTSLNTLQKIAAKQESMALLVLAVAYSKTASILRDMISQEHGNNGGMNPYPISGGICEHWERWQKDAVISLIHKQRDTTDKALSLWLAAGCHSSTFRAHKSALSNAI